MSNKSPVVLIIHEIFGMTDWVQNLADLLAAAGYIAVAPDLLSSMAPNGGGSSDFTQGQAVKAVSILNPDQITHDLNAIANYALKIPSAKGKVYVAVSAGAAARASGLPPTAATSLPLLFSTGGHRRPTSWRASTLRCTDSMVEMTNELWPLS